MRVLSELREKRRAEAEEKRLKELEDERVRMERDGKKNETRRTESPHTTLSMEFHGSQTYLDDDHENVTSKKRNHAV